MADTYDITFLGGGPAGYQGAIRAAQLGARVAVVEERFLGGVCLNWGCIPTKTVRASAEAGRVMRRAGEFGFGAVNVVPDMKAIIARKNRVVSGLRGSIGRLFQAYGISVVEGRGKLLSPGRIEVEKDGTRRIVESAKIVIATGSRPTRLRNCPIHPRVMLADDLLDIDLLPSHLLVVGGGSVGVEMAAIFRELGSQVTIIEAMDRLLPSEDVEMAEYVQAVLRRRKVKIICGGQVSSVSQSADAFNVALADGTELNPDLILQAVGRRLNSDGIGLAEAGVATENGRIIVDRHMLTNVPGIYAAGDVVGGWLLAHVAFAEGICAAEHAMGKDSGMDYKTIPRCVFTIPEYGAVGVSEEEARGGRNINVARFPFKSLGMGQAMGELEGLVKIITDATTDRILGAHIIGPHAADLIAEIALAMRADMPSSMIMETIHSHPALSEAVLEVAQALHGQAIHQPPQEAKR